MPDISRRKRELRGYYRKLRDSLTETEREQSDANILAQLLESEKYRKCRILLTYISVGSEVGTAKLIASALKDGKTVACPLCSADEHTMTFRCIDSVDDLSEGAYGIPEPRPDAPQVPAEAMTDSICIVPGLSFDASGGRLGYGGGYYDRFLAGYNGVSVGLCRAACLSDEPLPADRFDIGVDRVITG